MLRLKTNALSLCLALTLVRCGGGGDGAPTSGVTPPTGSAARVGTMIYVHINRLFAVDMASGKSRLLSNLVSVSSNRSFTGASVGPARNFALSYNTDAPLSNTAWLVLLKPDATVEAEIRLRYMVNGPPVISPDGAKIAFDASFYNNSLPVRKFLQVVSGTGDALYFYSNFRYPQWMPDGQLLMQGNDGLYLSGTDSKSAPTLIPNSDNIANHSISPDGTQIAFVRRSRTGAPLHVYIMNIDGSGVRQVTASADGGQTNVQFSPDGKNLMITTAGCISSFGGYPYVVGNVDEDLIHVIPVRSSMLNILDTRNLATTAVQGEDGLGRCTAGTLSWR